MTDKRLDQLSRLTFKLEKTQTEWSDMIVRLVDAGLSYRTVAQAAGVSHMTVRRISMKTVS
jgi:transposase-like protein